MKRTFPAALLSLCLVSVPIASQAIEGAKGMFYSQMNSASMLNSGISYWIELRRAGKVMKVDSRTIFKSGDRFRFHVTPNIDGHAYVVLTKGTTGTNALLFPVPGKESNVVKHGKEYVIPSATFLVFDSHPGKEKIRIVLSRSDLKAEALTSDGATDRVAVASIDPSGNTSNGGDQLVVGFPEDNEEKGLEPADLPEPGAKDIFRADTGVQHAHTRPRSPGSGTHHASHVGRHGHRRSTGNARVIPGSPSTIVVNSNPMEDLYAEIVLQHN